MSDTLNRWKLADLLSWVHEDVTAQLKAARESIGHEGEKGDASEQVWIDLFNQYLPTRYHAIKGFAVDSNGKFSDQIDVIIHDRHFTPRIFAFKSLQVVPIESVYAVFECKQVLNKKSIIYAREKVQSVKRLIPTSAFIPQQGQKKRKKGKHPEIIGGLLSLESSWSSSFGKSFREAMLRDENLASLRIGCAASDGLFEFKHGNISVDETGQHATRFLMRLTSVLQSEGTVAAIEMDKFEEHLSVGEDAQDLVAEGEDDDSER